MAKTVQLLKQARNAVAGINQTTDNPQYKALLTATDFVLNELLLQTAPDFYLLYLERGRALLDEGRNLVKKKVGKPLEPLALRNDLNAETNIDSINREIDELHQLLLPVVEALDESRSAEDKAYLNRLSDWEATLYSRHLEQVGGLADGAAKQITRETFQSYLRNRFPQWQNLTVTRFVALDGGFSKKTIMVETEDASTGRQAMVIRADQPVDILRYEGSDLTQEFHMIQLMRREGLPIAEPLWLEADRGALGTRFIVSRKAEGKTYGGNFGNNERLSAELVRSMIETFIKMHNIKPDPADSLTQRSHLREWLPFSGSLRDTTRYYVTQYIPRVARLADIAASPQLLRCLRWLERNVPDSDEAPVIVHIDFAFNNLIIDNDRITAVLDWESSRLGDPAEDILYTQMNLSEYVSMPEFLALYKAGTGRDISEYRMAYCRVSKCALSAIACLSSLRALENHDAAHINIATLAYKYLAIFGSTYNNLIAEAESVRGK